MNLNLHCFNPQFYIGARVGDTALENETGQLARTYGAKLDLLIAAVKVLAAAVPADTLTAGDQLVLDQLRALPPVPAGDPPSGVPRPSMLRQ